MASVVDICNLALAHLGDSATVSSIDPPEGSAQAEHCARFYPIARDAALSAHEWGFATKRVALALSGTAPANWRYSYALPASCVRVAHVLPAEATTFEEEVDFEVEDGYLLTNEPNAVARYIHRVTDTTRFSPLFVTALSWLLASYLTGPVRKGDKETKEWAEKKYSIELSRATLLDAKTRRGQPTHNVPWMASR